MAVVLWAWSFIDVMSAVRSGASPAAATQATWVKIVHALANPWFFAALLVLLGADFIFAFRDIPAEPREVGAYVYSPPLHLLSWR